MSTKKAKMNRGQIIVVAVLVIILVAIVVFGLVRGDKSESTYTPPETLSTTADTSTSEGQLRSQLTAAGAESVEITAPIEDKDFGGWIDVTYSLDEASSDDENETYGSEINDRLADVFSICSSISDYSGYGVTVKFSAVKTDVYGDRSLEEIAVMPFDAETIQSAADEDADSVSYKEIASGSTIDDDIEEYIQ